MFEQYFWGKINDSLISLEFKVTFGVSQSFSVIENREKSRAFEFQSIFDVLKSTFRFGYDLGHMDTVVFSAQWTHTYSSTTLFVIRFTLMRLIYVSCPISHFVCNIYQLDSQILLIRWRMNLPKSTLQWIGIFSWIRRAAYLLLHHEQVYDLQHILEKRHPTDEGMTSYIEMLATSPQ